MCLRSYMDGGPVDCGPSLSNNINNNEVRVDVLITEPC